MSPMKLVVPVGLRQYAESDSNQPLFIATTLDAPYVAAAAGKADEALRRIRTAIRSTLERSHPRLVAQVGTSAALDLQRRKAHLYDTAAYDWRGSDEGWKVQAKSLSVDVDVATRQAPAGLLEVSIPLFDVWTCVDPEALQAEETEEEAVSPVDRGVADLADALRRNHRHVSMHRPTPVETTVVSLEIAFEPVDLTRVDVEAMWMLEFDADEGADLGSESRPATPILDDVAHCWSALEPEEAATRGIDEAIGRQATLDEIGELLDGKIPSPVVLVGPARVGKTSLIRHLAWERIHGRTDSPRRIWFANSPRMTSTDAMVMDWREQCRQLVAELEDADDILYFGRAVEALDAGKYVGSDYNLAQFLKPVLSDRRIRVVAEATPQEWNELERRDIGFARTFTVVRIDDPPDDLALNIVVDATARIASREQVEIGRDVIERAWALQKRFATDGSIVGRTIDFVRRAIRTAANAFRDSIEKEEIVREFCRDTGLPPILLLDDRTLDLERVHETLSDRVLGQDDAVRKVCDVVGITKAGLSSPDRPLGSFLFVGPTGVGKTELARALADYLFGDEDRMVRVDMSEYSHADAYARLIGEGREDGDLTGPVRRQPFSVILLDEIEKAHPGVFDLLLQVLGEARLTDVNGRTTTFRNTIVIMTSNLGVDSLRPAIGFTEEGELDAWGTHFRREAERFFRPEFLARIDQFIPFRPLSEEIVRRIAEREMARVFERDGLRSQDVELEVDPRVHEWVAARGWDKRYGARPLKRVIEQEIVSELARRLAESAEAFEPSVTRKVRVAVPRGSVRKVGLDWRIESVSGTSTEASARRALLGQLERIASLRRRLQKYMHTAVFGDLEWQIDNFDVSSQSHQFWEDPNASKIATDAEHARRIVQPAREIAQELAALEDLANEAYHGRTFVLSEDIDERVEELTGRVGTVVMEILRGAYNEPDRAALFLIDRSSDDQWRRTLVDWYRKRADRLGWKVSLWRALPDRELDEIEIPEMVQYDELREAWEEADEPSGDIVAIEFEGHAARPLCRAEDGLHRLIASDGNAVVDVLELDEYSGWPWPHYIDTTRARSYVARTYNFRTREVTMPGSEPQKLNADDPFAEIEPAVLDAVWRITENEWE